MRCPQLEKRGVVFALEKVAGGLMDGWDKESVSQAAHLQRYLYIGSIMVTTPGIHVLLLGIITRRRPLGGFGFCNNTIEAFVGRITGYLISRRWLEGERRRRERSSSLASI